MDNQNNFLNKGISTPLGILIIVAVALIVGGVVAWQQGWFLKEEIKIPEVNIIPKDETADWKTYNSAKYNISFKYPNNWYAGEQQNSIYVNITPIPTISLTHGLPNALQIVVGKSPLEIPNYAWKHTTSQVILNGATGTKQVDEEPDRSEGLMSTRLFIEKDSFGYTIVFPNTNEKGVHNPVFDQIISSLKFLGADQNANWKTYKNNVYGFEIKYPPDSKITEGGDVFGELLNVNETDIRFSASGEDMFIHIGPQLKILPPPEVAAVGFIGLESANFDDIISEDLIINDVSFHRDYYWGYGGSASFSSGISAYIKNPHNGHYVSMGTTYNKITGGGIIKVAMPDGVKDMYACEIGSWETCVINPKSINWMAQQIKKEEKERIFDQMLSTFKFVK